MPRCLSGVEDSSHQFSSDDLAKPFLLETDAWGTDLGAVLAQKQNDGSKRLIRPIAYASMDLQTHERNYRITELGVVWAVKHFRPYLYVYTCEVFTDHSALTSLLNTPAAIREVSQVGHYNPRAGSEEDIAQGEQWKHRCPLKITTTY